MNYTKELTIFYGQKKWKPPQKAGNYEVRVIEKPQPVKLTHFDETGKVSSITIISKESDEQRPMFDIKNDMVVDDLSVQQYDPKDFLIVKPLQKNSVYLDLQWGNNKIPIMLPKEFFTFNEPIEILTGNWKLPDTSTLPVIGPGLSIEGSEPADLENCMVMTEVPADVVEKAGLAEGPHELQNVYGKTDFIKSLCNNAIGGGVGGVVNNFELLKDFFPGQKFYLKKYNGKYFVVFKGMAGTRATFKGTKYALKNPKVMALNAAKSPAAGAGAAIKGLKPTLRGNVLTVVIVGVVDLVAWQNGMLSDDGKFVSDLLVEFGMDLTKAAVSTLVAGLVVGFGCVLLSVIGITALPVFVIIAGGIALAVLIGMGLDYFDEQVGFTAGLRNEGNKVEKTLVNAFKETIVEPISQTIYQLERQIEWLYLRNIPFTM
jgi:hypothetical protein